MTILNFVYHTIYLTFGSNTGLISLKCLIKIFFTTLPILVHTPDYLISPRVLKLSPIRKMA